MPLSIAPTQVFWCEPTGRIRRYLRCYQGRGDNEGRQLGTPAVGDTPACQAKHGFCNAMIFLDEIEEELGEPHEGGRRYRVSYDPKRFPWDAFPTKCENCGQEMDKPERQVFTDDVFVVKTGPIAELEFVRREAPVGAMWHVTHYADIPDWCGRDGIALNVVTPGGEWHVDGPANNCTKPDDHVHRCWVRRGDPRTGYVHVDKDSTIQETCEAGAGSIWINKDGPRDWHGFLYRGYLIDADDHSRAVVDRLLDAPNPVAPAERVITPVQADMAKARRTVPRPSREALPVQPAVRAWRSNRPAPVKPSQ